MTRPESEGRLDGTIDVVWGRYRQVRGVRGVSGSGTRE